MDRIQLLLVPVRLQRPTATANKVHSD